MDIIQSPMEKVEEQPETKQLSSIRWTGAVFTLKAGQLLKLPQPTIATAIIYFHRFYCYFSYTKYDKHMVASACLFIACKAHEQHRRLRDIINIMSRVRFPTRKELNIVSQEFFKFKDMISEHEQFVLRALKFDLHVDLPYKYLLNYTKILLSRYQNKTEIILRMNKIAWGLLNDCLRTRLILDVNAKVLTVTCMCIGLRILNSELYSDWYFSLFNVPKSKIDGIAKQVSNMYTSNEFVK